MWMKIHIFWQLISLQFVQTSNTDRFNSDRNNHYHCATVYELVSTTDSEGRTHVTKSSFSSANDFEPGSFQYRTSGGQLPGPEVDEFFLKKLWTFTSWHVCEISYDFRGSKSNARNSFRFYLRNGFYLDIFSLPVAHLVIRRLALTFLIRNRGYL